MIAGGLFSINKTTFDHFGKYDSQMDIWVSGTATRRWQASSSHDKCN